MASALDVAAYILKKSRPMTAMKLQKLVYYSQAWSLVWDDPPDAPLFRNHIEAWANGPVVPALFKRHKGKFRVARIAGGSCRRLSKVQRETVDAVLRHYGHRSPLWLSTLSHSEPPWRKARKGLAPLDRGSRAIRRAAMEDYYGKL